MELIKDIKQVLHVLVLYLPIPVFWALYDQQVFFIQIVDINPDSLHCMTRVS
jgi:hypothetical protein